VGTPNTFTVNHLYILSQLPIHCTCIGHSYPSKVGPLGIISGVHTRSVYQLMYIYPPHPQWLEGPRIGVALKSDVILEAITECFLSKNIVLQFTQLGIQPIVVLQHTKLILR